jgi:flagellar hook-length control protein FliK
VPKDDVYKVLIPAKKFLEIFEEDEQAQLKEVIKALEDPNVKKEEFLKKLKEVLRSFYEKEGKKGVEKFKYFLVVLYENINLYENVDPDLDKANNLKTSEGNDIFIKKEGKIQILGEFLRKIQEESMEESVKDNKQVKGSIKGVNKEEESIGIKMTIDTKEPEEIDFIKQVGAFRIVKNRKFNKKIDQNDLNFNDKKMFNKIFDKSERVSDENNFSMELKQIVEENKRADKKEALKVEGGFIKRGEDELKEVHLKRGETLKSNNLNKIIKVEEVSTNRELFLGNYLSGHGFKIEDTKQKVSEIEHIKGVKINQVLEIVKEMVFDVSPDGEKKAILKLEPPELGHLDLEVRVHHKDVHIIAHVEKAEVLQEVKHHLVHIKSHLEEAGFNLKEFQVYVGGGTGGGIEAGFGRDYRDRNQNQRDGVAKINNFKGEEILKKTKFVNTKGNYYYVV